MRRVILLFALLAVVATWPQAVQFSSIPDNADAYFSLWRLGWIAHQLPNDPAHLFDGNIFYPEPNTLAYSDALLLEGVVGLPFIRAGVPIVYVYNALVLASFVASGVGMFVLVRRLTGATVPAILAGLVFAFTPYRFDHYYHLELLWAAWMPLAFWMVHRTLDSGRLRDGLCAGGFVALQILSSIYYGVFLCSVLIVLVIPLLGALAPGLRRRALAALAAGALLAAAVALPYTYPYSQVRATVGERGAREALLNAAGPRHYLASMPESRLEGSVLGSLGRHEKRLFPGFVALAFGILALWRPVTRTTLAYVLVLAVAMNLSFGPRGIGYEWLYEHVIVYRGLRAPARAGQVALLAFAVLAGIGCARLRGYLAAQGRRADIVIASLLLVAFAEYLVEPLKLTPVPASTPSAYAWLRTQPEGVVAEFPMPTKPTLPLHEARFGFLSTFHWQPIVNGYSGTWSARYVDLLDEVEGFPDGRSIETLRSAGVTYVVIHERYFGNERYRSVLEELRNESGLEPAGEFDDERFSVAIYRLLDE